MHPLIISLILLRVMLQPQNISKIFLQTIEIVNSIGLYLSLPLISLFLHNNNHLLHQQLILKHL